MEMTVAQIARVLTGEVVGDPDKKINGIAPIEAATPDDITYAAKAKVLKRIEATQAGAVIVPPGFSPAGKNLIQVDNPEAAFAKVIHFFHPTSRPEPGISPKASLGNGFVCGDDCHIGPFVAIQNEVRLGNRVVLHPQVTIGKRVVIGDDVEIFPNVTIADGCRIGNRVSIPIPADGQQVGARPLNTHIAIQKRRRNVVSFVRSARFSPVSITTMPFWNVCATACPKIRWAWRFWSTTRFRMRSSWPTGWPCWRPAPMV